MGGKRSQRSRAAKDFYIPSLHREGHGEGLMISGFRNQLIVNSGLDPFIFTFLAHIQTQQKHLFLDKKFK